MLKKTQGERAFDVLNVFLIFIATLAFLIPFWIVLATSFLSPEEAARRGVFTLFPQNFYLHSYEVLLSSGSIIYTAYANTLIRIVVGTFLNLCFTIPLAYGLSKKSLPGRTAITGFVFFTMLFSGGLIPGYLLVKGIGIYNTLWALILPGLVSTWNMLLMRNFFTQIPDSLEESAMIDGASVTSVILKIILPLSLPSIATIALFYAVGHWNSWFDAAMFLSNAKLYPVQIILRNVVVQLSSQNLNALIMSDSNPPPAQTMKCAVIIVTTVPILFIYPFVQRYFIKGMLVGSVKG